MIGNNARSKMTLYWEGFKRPALLSYHVHLRQWETSSSTKITIHSHVCLLAEAIVYLHRVTLVLGTRPATMGSCYFMIYSRDICELSFIVVASWHFCRHVGEKWAVICLFWTSSISSYCWDLTVICSSHLTVMNCTWHHMMKNYKLWWTPCCLWSTFWCFCSTPYLVGLCMVFHSRPHHRSLYY